MKAVTRITFLDDSGEKFFGEGPARLLHGIEDKGSLRSAAMSMDMAYTKALRIMKNAETALGFQLITRVTGGKDGGGSKLTPRGKDWLTRYESYRDACTEANEQLYRKYFPVMGCVIMASGMGKRFGCNKLMVDFHGAPMIQQALHATEGLFHRRVVVTRHEDVAQLCREQGVEVILHDLPHRSDTVRLGVEALGNCDCCMFLPGDQPLVRKETVEMLLENWKQSPKMIHRPIYEDTVGSPVVFPFWAFPELKSLPEGKGGNIVIKNHPNEVIHVPVANSFELLDADTPETLEFLKQLSK